MSLATKIQDQKSNKHLPNHVIIEALAGTGKTTTLIEGLKLMKGETPSIEPSPQQQQIWEELCKSPQEDSGCFVAFNKSIATELQERVPAGIDAMTLHSLGNRSVSQAFEKPRINKFRVDDIISEVLDRDIREIRKNDFDLLRATKRLVGLCKMNLVVFDSDPNIVNDQLNNLADHYDVDLGKYRSQVISLVPEVLERCKRVDLDNSIDFDDMVWLPVVLDLPSSKYDLLLVDECQDLNRCQQALARKFGRRLIFCGDKNQAIYGFAGADAESVNRLTTELASTEAGCNVLPLTVTRRCSHAVVTEAKKIVKAFEAHSSNHEGSVSYLSLNNSKTSYANAVKSGDMVLCRCNAPLVSQCFRLIKQGKPANIQGRDVGQGLVRLIKSFKVTTSVELTAALSDWIHGEEQKELAKRNPDEEKLIRLHDKHDCVLCFLTGCQTVDQVVNKIESMFTDEKSSQVVRLSSIHKAKGLEANRVFLLEPKGASVPHPMVTTPWQREQEYNLRYVAITRAIQDLIYVSEK